MIRIIFLLLGGALLYGIFRKFSGSSREDTESGSDTDEQYPST